MSTEIYYFSGTGNSLHVAKELQKRIPDTKLIPMVKYVNKDGLRTTGKTVGFVFPVHMMTFPFPVKKFVKKLDVRSANYIFTVSVKGGTFILSDLHMAKILKRKGKRLDCYFDLKMPYNSPTGVMPVRIPGMIDYPAAETEISELESNMQTRLDVIKTIVMSKEVKPKDDSPYGFSLLLKKIISALMAPFEILKEKNKINYYADSTCTGCGICEKVCLSKKIKLIDGRPVWQKHVQCFFCYACFAYCPAQSILVKKLYTEKQGRYVNPDVSVHEISSQNS
ncbi:MAG: EFR1 family ferrodoxin [Spirochaetales bacterium]|nr:EFR1 family ferrodoxin [Spirochaetales bacterium]